MPILGKVSADDDDLIVWKPAALRVNKNQTSLQHTGGLEGKEKPQMVTDFDWQFPVGDS